MLTGQYTEWMFIFPGTDMLTHLLMCEHKTAYSCEEDARANVLQEQSSKPVEEPLLQLDNVSYN